MALNLFTLMAKIGVDSKGFDKGIDGATSKGKEFAGKMAKATLAGVTAVGAGAIAIGKKAIESYSQYEQLAGGVKTLFGAGGQSLQEYAKSVGKSVSQAKGEYENLMSAQNTMISNANKAYKTAGLSANQYMDTVTSFSASMISSLGGDTQKASEYSNQAVIDMSDNANKMGTSVSSIQMTYQSLARGNYAMLDNLKLGYGGTKTEMQRLLKDAQKLTGQKYDISNFADVTQAIHAIQDEMGITGTTAKEASTTIEGSANSMKSAWQNVLTGIADDNQDFDGLMDSLVESIIAFSDNIIPRIKTVITGIATLVISFMQEVFPQLFPVLTELLSSLITQITTVLIPSLLQQLPTIIEALLTMVGDILSGLAEALPIINESLTTAILEIAQILTNPDTLNMIINSAVSIINALVQGLSESLPQIITAVIQIISALAIALTNPDLLVSIINAGLELLVALGNGFYQALPILLASLPEIITNVVQTLIKLLPKLVQVGIKLIGVLAQSLIQALPILIASLPAIIKAIFDAFAKTDWGKIGTQIINGLINGIKSMIENVKKTIHNIVSAIKSVFTGGLEIKSPSRLFKKYGKYTVQGFNNGVIENLDSVKNTVGNMATTVSDFSATPQIDDMNAYQVMNTGVKTVDYSNQKNSQKDVKVTLDVSDDGTAFARYLLKYLKIAEREQYA